jgi:hypothetical protein
MATTFATSNTTNNSRFDAVDLNKKAGSWAKPVLHHQDATDGTDFISKVDWSFVPAPTKTDKGKKKPSDPNVAKFEKRTVKVCQQHGCNGRVRLNSTRTFCWRHDPHWVKRAGAGDTVPAGTYLTECEAHDETQKRLRRSIKDTAHYTMMANKQRRRAEHAERQAEARKKKIANLRKHAAGLQRGIETRDQKIQNLHKTLEQKEKKVYNLRQTADRQRRALEQRNKDLAAANLELAQMDDELMEEQDAGDREVAALLEEMTELIGELEEAEQEAAAWQQFAEENVTSFEVDEDYQEEY